MAKHAKHAAPPRRRHSAQKHTSHKGVTLYTLGVLLVAVSALLFLRFWPRRSVDTVPPAVEVEPLLFRRSLLCLSRSLSSRHCASRLQGTTSSMHPSIRRPPGGLQRAKDTALITAI